MIINELWEKPKKNINEECNSVQPQFAIGDSVMFKSHGRLGESGVIKAIKRDFAVLETAHGIVSAPLDELGYEEDEVVESVASTGPHFIEKENGLVLWQLDHYHYAITKAVQPYEMVKACPDCSYEDAKQMMGEIGSGVDESAKPAWGSDWVHRWKPVMLEAGLQDADKVLRQIVQGDLDIYEVMAHPQTIEEKFASGMLQDMYDDVCVEYGLHGDDDLPEVLNRMLDELEDQFGMDESATPVWGTDWVHRWHKEMEESATPAWGSDWVHKWRSQGVSESRRPFLDKERLDERSGPVSIVRWAKPWRSAGRDGLNATGDAKAIRWSDKWNKGYEGNGTQDDYEDDGPIQQRHANLNPEYDTDYVKDYSPAFTQGTRGDPFAPKQAIPVDANNTPPKGSADNELVNVRGNIQPIKRNIKATLPKSRAPERTAGQVANDKQYNKDLAYWVGNTVNDLGDKKQKKPYNPLDSMGVVDLLMKTAKTGKKAVMPTSKEMIPLKLKDTTDVYGQDEKYWVSESQVRRKVAEGLVARFGHLENYPTRLIEQAIYNVSERYVGVQKITESDIGIMACQVFKILKS